LEAPDRNGHIPDLAFRRAATLISRSAEHVDQIQAFNAAVNSELDISLDVCVYTCMCGKGESEGESRGGREGEREMCEVCLPLCLPLSLSLYIYIYMDIYIYLYMYVDIICIYTPVLQFLWQRVAGECYDSSRVSQSRAAIFRRSPERLRGFWL